VLWSDAGDFDCALLLFPTSISGVGDRELGVNDLCGLDTGFPALGVGSEPCLRRLG
jgi:hypothetical protein